MSSTACTSSTSASTRTPISCLAPASPASRSQWRGKDDAARSDRLGHVRHAGRARAAGRAFGAGARARARGRGRARFLAGPASVSRDSRLTAPNSSKTARRHRSPQHRRRHRAGHAPARHDPRRVLQHLLHRPEGARGDGGDAARGPRAVPLPRAGVRAAPHGTGPAAQRKDRAACATGHAAERVSDPALLQEAVAAATTRCADGRGAHGGRGTRTGADQRSPPLRGAQGRMGGGAEAARGGCGTRWRNSAWPSATWKRPGREAARLVSELQAATAAAARITELGTMLTQLPALREEAASLPLVTPRATPGARPRVPSARNCCAGGRRNWRSCWRRRPARRSWRVRPPALNPVREARDFTLRALEARRTLWVQDTQEAKTKREGLRDQYKDLAEQRKRIVTAGAAGACPLAAVRRSGRNTTRCWACWSPGRRRK